MRPQIFCLLVGFLFILPAIAADTTSLEYKDIDYCIQIENLDRFPEYKILIDAVRYDYRGAFDDSPIETNNFPLLEQIPEGECIEVYKLEFHPTDAAHLYAVSKDASPDDFGSSFYQDHYSSNRQDLIPSDLIVQPPQVALSSQISKIRDVLRIESISAGKLNLKYDHVTYTFDDGSTETIAYMDQTSRPSPSATEELSLIIPAILILVLALVCIGYLLLRKARK